VAGKEFGEKEGGGFEKSVYCKDPASSGFFLPKVKLVDQKQERLKIQRRRLESSEVKYGSLLTFSEPLTPFPYQRKI